MMKKNITDTAVALVAAAMATLPIASCDDETYRQETTTRGEVEIQTAMNIGDIIRMVDIGVDGDALTLLADLALSGASGQIGAGDVLMLLGQRQTETPDGTPTVNLLVRRGDTGLVRIDISGSNLYGETRPRNARVNIDLLDTLRAEVEIADLPLLVESLRRADANKHDGALFRAEVATASGAIAESRVAVGDSIVPGRVRIGSFRDEFFNEWYWMPMLAMDDGTSFAPIEGFASESNLRTLRRLAQITFGSYNSLLGDLDQ